MKILQVIQRPQLRGAEIFACQLSGHLISAGHQVLVVTLFPGDARLPYDGEIMHLNRPERNRLWDVAGWRRLSRIIIDFQPDVVQANAGDTLRYAVMSRIFFRWKSALVYRNANMMSGFVRSGLRLWFIRFLLHRTDHIISVSQACRLDLCQRFGIPQEKTDVVEIGIESWAIGSFPGDLLPLRGKGPLLASVGSLVPEKNHEGLLRIFHRLLDHFPDATLLIIGKGKLENRLRALAMTLGVSERVHFLGSRPDVPALLSGCDVFLLPSLVEGLPAVILESMYAGCPVVAYDIGGVGEVVMSGSTGWLAAVGAEEEFSEKVVEALTDQHRTSVVVEKAKDLVRRKFLNAEISLRFISVYRRIIEQLPVRD